MFTTFETSPQAEARDQRERLAGLVQRRRAKFRTPRLPRRTAHHESLPIAS